jgi:hypothetical protein
VSSTKPEGAADRLAPEVASAGAPMTSSAASFIQPTADSDGQQLSEKDQEREFKRFCSFLKLFF